MNKTKRNISIILFSILTLIFASCSSTPTKAKVPAWVFYPKETYPDSDFLTYVGHGESRNEAELDALRGLSSIFEQNIESSSKATTRMDQAKKEGVVATNIDKGFSVEILKNVNVENLIGVEVKEFWFDESTYDWYAIAVLDKKQAKLLYKDMLIKNAEVIAKITNGIKDVYSIQAYSSYDFAQEIARENKQHLDRLYVIDYHTAEALKNYAVPESKFLERKKEIANHIPIYINIKGDVNNVCTSAFLDALKTQNFIGTEDSSARYSIEGTVNYKREDSRDGKTSKCNYDLQSTFLDKKTGKQMFPINIRGRQAHVNYDRAKDRAISDLIGRIEETFTENLETYVSGN